MAAMAPTPPTVAIGTHIGSHQGIHPSGRDADRGLKWC